MPGYNLPFEGTPIILASNSPRRKQLLQDAGFRFSVQSKNVEEKYSADLRREEIPLYLSKIKAEAFEAELGPELLIASDTIVHLNGAILEKPADRNHAIAMLQSLSGKTHEVVTAVTILYQKNYYSFFEVTEVTFGDVPLPSIEHYVDAFKPFDKAGSYGIQEWIGITHIKKINGDFYNVMGLPVQKLFSFLRDLESDITK